MSRKSEDLLASVDEDLRGIWRTASKGRDRIANIREEDLSEEERETRRDNLHRLEMLWGGEEIVSIVG
jgi:hypothetical protein